MIGREISHYKILERLGGGGMGVVYKAEDTKLKRLVALKFLPPEISDDPVAKARFIQEARAASALEHRNICNIHEIEETEDGQLFIAMAYYKGDSLKQKLQRGALEIEESVNIALQVAKGLARAHEEGIIHRDIKTANVMLTERGEAKIVDFGLAKLAEGTGLTDAGTTMGTVAYMSPEQAGSGEVDHRTDIWSLGVVLYEMVTGRLPFEGGSPAALLLAIVSADPQPASKFRQDIPYALQRILTKALEKNREKRYQTVKEMLADLGSVEAALSSGRATTRAIKPVSRKPQRAVLYGGLAAVLVIVVALGVFLWPFLQNLFTGGRGRTWDSIAVLPFVDMSPQRDQEYFCDGMAETILNKLTKVEGLRVAARTSSFRFRGRDLSVSEIGGRLNVSAVLEGSVIKSGDRLRITAQLIDVADGYHIWSESYDRELDDLFEVQDEIAVSIVNALRIELGVEEQEQLERHHTENRQAFELYQRGRFFWNQRTEGGLNTAIEYFLQAIELDPEYTMAYVGLAESYILLTGFGFSRPEETLPRAEEYVERALQLDPSMGEVYSIRANIRVIRNYDWEGAESDFRKAIELNPDYPTAHHWYSLTLLSLERFDEAIAEMEVAFELDPLSMPINTDLAVIYYHTGQFDAAIEQLRNTLELYPDSVFARDYLYRWLLVNGSFEEALVEFKELLILTGRTEFAESVDALYAESGFEGVIRVYVDQFGDESKPYDLACYYMLLNERDRAFDYLESALSAMNEGMLYLRFDPAFEELRTHPRFIDMLREMNLLD